MWSKLICFSLHFIGAEHVRVLRHSWAMEAWLCVSALCTSGNESCGARVAWHAWRVVLRAHTPSPRGSWCSADNESHQILITTQCGEDTSCSAVQTSTSLCAGACPAGWWETPPRALAAPTAAPHWLTRIPISHLNLITSKACVSFSFSERKSSMIWLFVWAQVA